jgi:hypothetical protein
MKTVLKEGLYPPNTDIETVNKIIETLDKIMDRHQ